MVSVLQYKMYSDMGKETEMASTNIFDWKTLIVYYFYYNARIKIALFAYWS